MSRTPMFLLIPSSYSHEKCHETFSIHRRQTLVLSHILFYVYDWGPEWWRLLMCTTQTCSMRLRVRDVRRSGGVRSCVRPCPVPWWTSTSGHNAYYIRSWWLASLTSSSTANHKSPSPRRSFAASVIRRRNIGSCFSTLLGWTLVLLPCFQKGMTGLGFWKPHIRSMGNSGIPQT